VVAQDSEIMSKRTKVFRVCGLGFAVLSMMLTGCAPEPSTPRAAAAFSAEALDDAKPVQSCDTDTMQRIAADQKYLSWEEESAICQVVVNRFGPKATGAVLNTMFVGVSAFKLRGDKDDAKEQAYQLANLMEARNVESPQRIHDTLDVAFRLYETTDGHVTPKDLNEMLRSSGSLAETMSDDGVTKMGLVLWEAKKTQGN
jgi:hypothetical protein